MKPLIITPLKSVGGVVFGEPRQSVRGKVGTRFKEFRKTGDSANSADDFGWCHIFYDAQNNCEAVEVFNDGHIVLSLDGTNLFGLTFASLAEMLQRKDKAATLSPPDITSRAFGIAAYGEAGKIETILVGARGYVQ